MTPYCHLLIMISLYLKYHLVIDCQTLQDHPPKLATGCYPFPRSCMIRSHHNSAPYHLAARSVLALFAYAWKFQIHLQSSSAIAIVSLLCNLIAVFRLERPPNPIFVPFSFTFPVPLFENWISLRHPFAILGRWLLLNSVALHHLSYPYWTILWPIYCFGLDCQLQNPPNSQKQVYRCQPTGSLDRHYWIPRWKIRDYSRCWW